MSTSEKSLLKSFIVFVLLVAVSVAVTVWYRERMAGTAQASAGLQSSGSLLPTSAPPAQEISVHSSNADKKLILRTARRPDNMTEYTYVIADISGAHERVLFDKTLPSGSSMTLPANSWDPTDTYVFLEEKDNGVPDYFVMKSTGGSQIDVGAVWNEKKIPYTIRTATGWASGTLLIIYTSDEDGSRGPAFWFEIPSTAILQLAA